LWAASTVSSLGDGMYLAALPLLAATLTRDPLAVSVVTFAGWLPWLLFALPAGALVDRLDRRRVMWTVDAARALVVGVLTVAVLAGWASIPLLAVAGFLVGAGQTLFENAAQAMVVAVVGRDPRRLERANGQLVASLTVGQQLVGPAGRQRRLRPRPLAAVPGRRRLVRGQRRPGRRHQGPVPPRGHPCGHTRTPPSDAGPPGGGA
jgi:MFS family permease